MTIGQKERCPQKSLVLLSLSIFQVRDAALKVKDDLPRSDVNREYYIQNIDTELANNPDYNGPAGAVGKIASHKSELLTKLARNTPYYKRNRPHICSFWVKGECKRGEECPYRCAQTSLSSI